MSRKIAFITLGCKLNYAETSTWERAMAAAGWEAVPWTDATADICLVNTCSVTEHSDKKSRNIIRHIHKTVPQAGIVVTGCSAQLRRESLERIEGVLRVFGAGEKNKVVPFCIAAGERMAADCGQKAATGTEIPVKAGCGKVTGPGKCEEEGRGSSRDAGNCGFFRAYSTGERTRAFLKVQDGCDYKCAYCTVPYARGESRCASIEEIIEDARAIAASGIKEIVITGVNTGDFGRNTGESFLDLLKALNDIDGIERYRISSIEPNLLTDDILDWAASGTKILPHFHIPLQSGCDAVLERMGRRYRTAGFAAKIDRIRQAMESPGKQKVFIGIDVIAGFPGESDEMFRQTCDFLSERIQPSFIHIFPYSRRPGTVAASMPGQVQDRVKTQRVKILEALSARLHSEFIEANRGLASKVLLESVTSDGRAEGWSENYIRVSLPCREGLINTIVNVTL